MCYNVSKGCIFYGKRKKHRKYTVEQKLEIIKDKEENNLSNGELSLKYGINKTSIREWVNAYKNGGTTTLSARIPNKKNGSYTFDFKLRLVTEKLSSNYSYNEIASKYGINRCVLQDWVYKYNKNGEDGLKGDLRGKAPKGGCKKTTISKKERKNIDKALLDEVEHLRTEVAYLKNSMPWFGKKNN